MPAPRPIRCLAAAVAALSTLPAAEARQDPPTPAAVVPIQITGDAASRFTLVVLADGYTAADMPAFRAQLDRHLNIMWSIEPFRSYRNYFNVYAVEAISEESGITCDPEVRLQKKTAFGTNFGGGCTNINARGVTVPREMQAKVREYAARATPDPDQILIIANSDTYGGIGGALATSTGGNALSPLITPHEIGHSLGRLGDEYTYSARGRPGGTYTGGEPSSAHMTLLTEDEMRAQQKKWWRWLGEPSEAGGVIGRFEGGSGNTRGIWRPSQHSMMISLGYYFDQVSREQMVRQIAARVGLIAAATPSDAPVSPDDVLWIVPAHPVYHELTITWSAGGRALPNPANLPYLDLSRAGLPAGDQTVTVTVVDPTPFVRDPDIRATVLTATRTWTIGAGGRAAAGRAPRAGIGGSTQTARPVGGRDVVYIEPHAPSATGAPLLSSVTWRLNNTVIAGAANRLSFPIADRALAPGTHRLDVRVGPPGDAREADLTRAWTIDNTPPTVRYTLSPPVASLPAGTTAEPHVFMRDEFTMALEPQDDQPGYLVAEFRVNGDGWHHYYGWPDAPPGTPFRFTPRGTNIKELIYGSLSREGLSPQPWEAREPGWGTHRIEYRAIDAAGNIGAPGAFRVTFMPAPACTATITGTREGGLTVHSGVTCLDGATIGGPISVAAGASLVATHARILGAVTATGAMTLELTATTVEGPVSATATTGRLTIFGLTAAADVTLSDSLMAAPPLVTGSRVRGVLSCRGNATTPTNGGTPNALSRGGLGQCAGM